MSSYRGPGRWFPVYHRKDAFSPLSPPFSNGALNASTLPHTAVYEALAPTTKLRLPSLIVHFSSACERPLLLDP